MRVEGQLVLKGTNAQRGIGRAWARLRAGESGAAALGFKDVANECPRIAARPMRDTTSITRAATGRHERSPCWSMRCTTETEALEQLVTVSPFYNRLVSNKEGRQRGAELQLPAQCNDAKLTQGKPPFLHIRLSEHQRLTFGLALKNEDDQKRILLTSWW